MAIATFIFAVFDVMDEEHERKRWEQTANKTRATVPINRQPAPHSTQPNSNNQEAIEVLSVQKDDSLRQIYDRNHPDYHYELKHGLNRHDEWHGYFND